VIFAPLKLPRSLTKIPEQIPRERIEPVVCYPLKARWKCLTEEEVVIGLDCNLVLVLAEMKEWIGGSRIMIKGWHHKLLLEAEHGDLS